MAAWPPPLRPCALEFRRLAAGSLGQRGLARNCWRRQGGLLGSPGDLLSPPPRPPQSPRPACGRAGGGAGGASRSAGPASRSSAAARRSVACTRAASWVSRRSVAAVMASRISIAASWSVTGYPLCYSAAVSSAHGSVISQDSAELVSAGLRARPCGARSSPQPPYPPLQGAIPPTNIPIFPCPPPKQPHRPHCLAPH